MTLCAPMDAKPLVVTERAETLLAHLELLNRRVGTRMRVDMLMGNVVLDAADFNAFMDLVRDGKIISRDGYVWLPALDSLDYNRSSAYLDSILKMWQDEGVSNDVMVFLTSDPGKYIPPDLALRVLAEYRGITNEDIEYEFIEDLLPRTIEFTVCTPEYLTQAISGIFNCSIDTTKAPFDRIVEKAMNEFKQRRCTVLTKRLTELENELDAVRLELNTLKA